MRASLARYEPEPLGLYRSGNCTCSRLLEFLALLVNGEWQAVPLPRAPVNQVLATTRLFFGHEAIEYRLPSATRVGAMLGIKEYPTPSVVGMFNRLLSAPFPFVLTQSFAFLTKAASQALLQRQFNRMVNAGDFAVSQAQELQERLRGWRFEAVFSSPLLRALDTCRLAGLDHDPLVRDDLREWNYGAYEGLTPKQIHEKAPGWLIFRDGCPGGETPEQVAARADRVIARARAVEGDVALFAHGHVFRVLVARYLCFDDGHSVFAATIAGLSSSARPRGDGPTCGSF